MSDYKLATRSLCLRLLEKIFLIGLIVLGCSPVCYGFQWKGMEIIPSLTSRTEYNDNIFYDEEEGEEDVINRVSPGLAIRVPGRRSELELAYTAGFEFFAKHTDLNIVAHTAMGRVRIQPLEHLIFTLNDSFSRGEDVSEVDIYGLIWRRARYWLNTVTPSLEYIFGPDRVLKLNYENTIFDYDSPDLPDSRMDTVNPVLTYGIGHSVFTLDYTYNHGYFETDFDELDGHAIVLGYEYRLNPLTSILANTHFALRNFTGPEVSDYKVYAFLVGLRRDLTPHLSISAEGGYLRYAPEKREETDNFIGNFTVTYEVERTRFNFIAETGYEEFFVAIENLGYANAWGVTGILSHTLHRFWLIELMGSYRERDYEYRPRDDRFWTMGGTLVFEPVDWFKGELRYEHEVMDSTVRGSDYDVNRVMLTLQFRY